MTLYEYTLLTDTAQWSDLWENGIFLTNRKYLDSKFSLYVLHYFFVEVELDPVTNKIKGKTHFKQGEILNKYSGSIDISKIE
ncbi:hypothetical protein [Zobellia nedashkovskayae]|uniref:hypothetical protein n=1 Tax=Zobellia nedashkovskayae TaxID=2779510 RepID=UPI00188C3202|nr:hypothetical protein [Zobellia nedashkovskayae]